MKNRNKSLFWYGFFANFKKFLGNILVIGGFISFVFIHWLISVIIIICGFILIAKGHSQRFDYQRQSGYIVHSGD
jgi:magnesium-transporting ATPase (P-type)